MNKEFFKKPAVRIIAIILCLAIICAVIVISLTQCKGTKPTNTSSDDGYVDNQGEEYEPDDDPIDENSDPYDGSEDEPIEEESGLPVDYDTLSIYNSDEPIMTNYLGASGTVYHSSAFVTDTYGRNYTEEMREIELTRLKNSGIKYTRCYFRAKWVWDPYNKKFDFNTQPFNEFVEYCKALDKKGIQVCFNAGWYIKDVYAIQDVNGNNIGYNYTQGMNQEQSPPYIFGMEPGVDNYFGELDGYNFSGLTDDQVRLRKIGIRSGNLYKEVIKALRKKGVTNCRNVYVYTEPAKWKTESYGQRDLAPDYIQVLTGYRQAFKRGGDMNNVNMIGPDQSYTDGTQLLTDCLREEAKGNKLFDIYSTHHYGHNAKDEDDTVGELMESWASSMEAAMMSASTINAYDTSTFWCDEYQSRSDVHGNGVESPWNGVQSMVGIISMMKHKVQNTSWWQIFDQLWTDSLTNGGEFNSGIHVCGMAPSLLISTIPKSQYYAVSNPLRYIAVDSDHPSTVYPVDVPYASFLYMNAVERSDGDWAIVVCSTDFVERGIEVKFDIAINKTLYRHAYTANTPMVSTKAHLPDVDRVYKDVKDVFYDTIPAGSTVVYTSCKWD